MDHRRSTIDHRHSCSPLPTAFCLLPPAPQGQRPLRAGGRCPPASCFPLPRLPVRSLLLPGKIVQNTAVKIYPCEGVLSGDDRVRRDGGNKGGMVVDGAGEDWFYGISTKARFRGRDPGEGGGPPDMGSRDGSGRSAAERLGAAQPTVRQEAEQSASQHQKRARLGNRHGDKLLALAGVHKTSLGTG